MIISFYPEAFGDKVKWYDFETGLAEAKKRYSFIVNLQIWHWFVSSKTAAYKIGHSCITK